MQRLACVLLVCLLGPAAAAKALPAPAPTDSRVAVAAGALKGELTSHAATGYRVVSINGWGPADKTPKYAVVWRKEAGPAQIVLADLSSAAYKKALADNAKKGFRLTSVSGYDSKRKTRYAAVWEQRADGAPLVAQQDLTSAGLKKTFNSLTAQGYRLTHISGWSVDPPNPPRFAVIFEKSTGPAFATLANLTQKQLNAQTDAQAKKGLALKTVSAYDTSKGQRYVALWEANGTTSTVRTYVKPGDYGRIAATERLGGGSLISLQGAYDGVNTRLQAVWRSALRAQDKAAIESAAKGYLAKYKVPGISIAVAKDDRLVYAGSFGKATNTRALDPFFSLRVGSISKTITGAALYRLVEKGYALLPSLDVKVFGPDGLLGPKAPAQYRIALPASMKPLEGATLRQFLNHTSGLRGDLPDPVDNKPAYITCSTGNLSARLQALFKDTDKPLVGNPGEYNSYSNVSHMIAERVIERVTGADYDDVVRAAVFKPAGVTTAHLFTIDEYDPKTGEAMQFLPGTSQYAEYPRERTCEKKPPGTGAGGWDMTPKDLVRYLVNVNGRPEREIITPAHHTESITPGTASLGGPTTYGPTWGLKTWTWGCQGATVTRDIVQGHNGALDGGYADLHELPNGISFAVIINTRYADCRDTSATASVVPAIEAADWPDYDLF